MTYLATVDASHPPQSLRLVRALRVLAIFTRKFCFRFIFPISLRYPSTQQHATPRIRSFPLFADVSLTLSSFQTIVLFFKFYFIYLFLSFYFILFIIVSISYVKFYGNQVFGIRHFVEPRHAFGYDEQGGCFTGWGSQEGPEKEAQGRRPCC